MSASVRHPEPLEVAKANPDDIEYWSVTTIIGALAKDALLYWSAEQAAIAAIESPDLVAAMVKDQGKDEAIKWLRDARFRRPKTTLSSTDLGTAAHTLCEMYALDGVRPDRATVEGAVENLDTPTGIIPAEADVLEKMLDQFDGWLQRFTPKYEAAEMTVYSPRYRYAGTLDAIMTIGGVRFMADYKTSRETHDARGKLRTPYPEQVGLQLAAYAGAEFAATWRPRRTERYRRRYYLLGPGEDSASVPVPKVDSGLVIQLTPGSCEAYPITLRTEERGDFVFRAFLHTIEAFRWKDEDSRHVMRPPLS